MGKTQLTMEYIKQHHNDYSAIIWLDARDESSLKQSFASTAQRILRKYSYLAYVKEATTSRDPDKTVEAVQRWLDELKNDRWLVVYDNYDDVDLSGHEEDRKSVGLAAEDGRNFDGEGQLGTVASKAYNIRPYFPETDHGAIIITTRLSKVKLGHSIQLGKLKNVDDSLAILASTSNRADLKQGK
jgi:hypothetical protein